MMKKMEIAKQYIKKYWQIAVAAVLAVALAVCLSNSNEERIRSEARLQEVTDSLYQIHSADSVAYCMAASQWDSVSKAHLTTIESLTVSINTRKIENKVYVKTVYKDSVREVYIDNSEMVTNYEKSIKKLSDSLASVSVAKTDTLVQYVETVVHDTIVQYTEQKDSVVTTEITKPVKTFALYADGTYVYDLTDGHGYNVEAGGKYFVKGPIYLKGAVRYNGSVGIAAGIGGELDF